MLQDDKFLNPPKGTYPLVRVTNNLDKTTPGTALDAMQGHLLNDRVAYLENNSLDILFFDYWQATNDAPTEPIDGEIWAEYTPETDYLIIIAFWVWSNYEWVEIMGDNTMPISLNKIYISRGDNIQYRWNGISMIALTYPLSKTTIEGLLTGEISSHTHATQVTQQNIGSLINSVAEKATLDDNDEFPIMDSGDGNKLKKHSKGNLKIAMLNQPKRTVALVGFDIVLKNGEDFTKLTGMATPSTFTINAAGLILKKPFRLFMTGGTLAVSTFTGYTTHWLVSTLVTDYVPANVNILYCEIREANHIYLFWGE